MELIYRRFFRRIIVLPDERIKEIPDKKPILYYPNGFDSSLLGRHSA
jgi:hypothetical protein